MATVVECYFNSIYAALKCKYSYLQMFHIVLCNQRICLQWQNRAENIGVTDVSVELIQMQSRMTMHEAEYAAR